MNKIIVAVTIGVSFLMISSCSSKPQYDGIATWEFINDSSYSLEIKDVVDSFSLAKGESHSFDTKTGSSFEITENSFFAPFFPGAFKIIISGDREITTSPITDIKNYTSEKISDNHYKFSYTFTDEDFPEE